MALSPPLVHYAGLVFTEVPAALGVAVVLRARRRAAGARRAGAAGPGCVLAFLPWLNVRYAVLSAVLVALRSRAAAGRAASPGLLAPSVCLGVALALYHFALYGFFDPRRVYGRRPELRSHPARGAARACCSTRSSACWSTRRSSPWRSPASSRCGARDRRLGHRGARAGARRRALTAGTWHMWRGGFNPPARFLVPVVPVLALGVARGAAPRARRAGGAARGLGAVGWAWPAPGAAARPPRPRRHGAASSARAPGPRSGRGCCPGTCCDESATGSPGAGCGRRALLAAAALARGAAPPAAWPRPAAWPGGGGRGGLARCSDARTGGRDAVRVIGPAGARRAGLALEPSARGPLGPGDLDLGPALRAAPVSRRAPSLGERLRLPPGTVPARGGGRRPREPRATRQLEVQAGAGGAAARGRPSSRRLAGFGGFDVRRSETRPDPGPAGGGRPSCSECACGVQPLRRRRRSKRTERLVDRPDALLDRDATLARCSPIALPAAVPGRGPAAPRDCARTSARPSRRASAASGRPSTVLVERYQRDVYRLCYRYVNNHARCQRHGAGGVPQGLPGASAASVATARSPPGSTGSRSTRA